MKRSVGIVFAACSLLIVTASEPNPCALELRCSECLPDDAPLVRSHHAVNGSLRVPHGHRLELACAPAKFLLFPALDSLWATCEGGRYRLAHDRTLRTLLELGCQENAFEDVLHEVSGCAEPLQGRVYRFREARGPLHIAALCYDPDRARTLRAHTTTAPRNKLALPPHEDRTSPLTLLGNFQHMFDARTRHEAELLFAGEHALTRRLRAQLRGSARPPLGLAPATLLAPAYFQDQNGHAARFASNAIAAWTTVAEGNLLRAQADVAGLLRRAEAAGRELRVSAGTHGTLALRSSGELYLKPGRFPVPRYVWTAVREPQRRRGLAIVVLNDPLVAVSDIREAVFCESLCGRVQWAGELRRERAYEVPLFGLAFCCSLSDFAAVVQGAFADQTLKDMRVGDEGLLLTLD